MLEDIQATVFTCVCVCVRVYNGVYVMCTSEYAMHTGVCFTVPISTHICDSH